MMNGHEVMLDAVRKRLQELVGYEVLDYDIQDIIREIERFQRAVREKWENTKFQLAF